MLRLIILSWVCFIAGLALTMALLMEGSMRATGTAFAVGTVLTYLPYVLWMLTAERISGQALNRPPDTLIQGLAISSMCLLCIGYFALIHSDVGPVEVGATSVSMAAQLSIAAFPLGFALLFAAIILTSRRMVDASDSPLVARGSRIFLLCICFFYVAIGMFFIAPQLKAIKARTP